MNDYSITITTSTGSTTGAGSVTILEKKVGEQMSEYRIRKLTPTECFRLMGLTKEDADKCYAVGESNSQLYKQAGNGIITNCPQLLFEHLYKALYNDNFVCTDESDILSHDFVENKPKITANVLFSGVGMQERGIENSGCWNLIVNHTSEIEKNAVVSYAAIHCGLTQELIDTYSEYPSKDEMLRFLSSINLGYDPVRNKTYNWNMIAKKKPNEINKYWLACKLSNNLGDINKIENLPYADLWTYSFPCTDISVAGKMKGIEKGKTRSGLLYEVERLLGVANENGTLPKFLMLENVKNLVGKQFKPQFDDWCAFLEKLGYANYWMVLNGKDCGIPQNRERIFVISIRKDVDNGKFEFPKPFDNGMRLKDILEDEIDEKYYITNDKATQLIEELISNGSLDEPESDVTGAR